MSFAYQQSSRLTPNVEDTVSIYLGESLRGQQRYDPYYIDGRLWNMYGDSSSPSNSNGSQASEAWSRGVTGRTTNVVGIIDTGINYTHPDLYLNIWLNQREIPQNLRGNLQDVDLDGLITFRDLNAAVNLPYTFDFNKNGYVDAGDLLVNPIWENGIDEDRNGFTDDLIGWDFESNDNDPYQIGEGHGTEVSGVIGAIGGNQYGGAGVNWAIQMMPLRGFGPTPIEYFTNAGLNAAPTEIFLATNNSYTNDDPGLLAPITRGADNNILFVTAAGNRGLNTDIVPVYPAALSTLDTLGYDAIIGVSSIDPNGGRSSFANFGSRSVDIYAPGSSIWLADANGGFLNSSGTSYAAPHVTGALALYASVYPYATSAQIALALKTSAAQAGGRLDISVLLKITPQPTVSHDVLIGTNEADVIDALTGDDSVFGAAGNDSLLGGAGNDTLEGGLGNNTLSGGYAGSDWVMYPSASTALTIDLIAGRVRSSLEEDSLLGFEGVVAGRANDSIQGSSLTETLDGGSGDDTLVGGLGAGDWLSYMSSSSGVTVNLTLARSSGTAGNDSALGFEGIIGSSSDDELVGSIFTDTLVGGAGDDTLDGRANNDLLMGNSGNDIVSYAAESGPVTVNLVFGVAFVASGSDSIVEVEGAIGSRFSDSMVGSSQNDTFFGREGNDTILGGGGDADWVSYSTASGGVTVSLLAQSSSGADGRDSVVGFEGIFGSAYADNLSGSESNDTLAGGMGADTLIGNSGTADWASFAKSSLSVRVNLSAGSVLSPQGNDSLVSIENVVSGNGDDELIGDVFNNILSGGPGNDSLIGQAGADSLDGGPGNDLFYGAGSDSLFGADGQDTFRYQSLSDLIAVGRYVDGGVGNDQIELQFSGTVEDRSFIDIRNIESILQNSGNAGRLLLGKWAALAMSNVIVVENANNVDGSELLDYIRTILRGSNGADTLNGGTGSDTITGVGGDDRLIGNSGTDSLNGGNGTDTLIGGDDNDTLNGGFDGDLLIGGNGLDLVSYALEGCPVTVDLSTGVALGRMGVEFLKEIEAVNGTIFADVLIGSSRSETFFGGSGSDTIIGGAGAGDWIFYTEYSTGVSIDFGNGVAKGPDGTESLAGLEGIVGTAYADFFVGTSVNETFVGGIGADTLLGNGGTGDWASYADLAFDLRINLATGFMLSASGIDLLVGIENLLGGAGRDELYGNDLDNFLAGGDAGDILNGGLGADTLEGGNGEDFLFASGADSLSGGAGIDAFLFDSLIDLSAPGRAVNGGPGYDRIELRFSDEVPDISFRDMIGIELVWQNSSSPGRLILAKNAAAAMNNRIAVLNAYNVDGSGLAANADASYEGSEASDYLVGGAGADTILGNSGHDVLIGNWGNDSLFGGMGSDTLLGGEGTDTLFDYSGSDFFDFGNGNDTLNASTFGLDDTIDGGGGRDTIYIGNFSWSIDASSEWKTYSLSGKKMYLRNWESIVAGIPVIPLPRNTIEGTSGADTIVAPNLTNFIVSGGGDDRINGGLADDTIDGGAGNDTINERMGNNFLILGDGDDLCEKRFSFGKDTIFGGGGNDTINSWFDNDWIHGGAGNDLIIAGSGNDTVYGGTGADLIDAADGDDYLIYFERSGNDTFYGGAGADTLDLGFGYWTVVAEASGTRYTNADSTLLVFNIETVILEPLSPPLATASAGQTTSRSNVLFQIKGSADDDLHLIVETQCSVFEKPGEGVDTIMTWVDLVLPENVEVAKVASGVSGISVTGGTGNDVLIGNGLANSFNGGAGDDVILAGNVTLADIYALFSI